MKKTLKFKQILSQQNIYKYQRQQWSVLFVAIIMAVVTSSFITTINRQAERSAKAQFLLISLKEQLNQLSALEWQSFAEKELNPELVKQIQSSRNQSREITNELYKTEPNLVKLQHFIGYYNKYNIAVDKEFQLIAAGQMAQAATIDKEQVDPAYDRLKDEIINLNVDYNYRKQQAAQIAERGSALALLVFVGVIGTLLWKFVQARELAQVAVAEQKILSQSEERFRSLIHNASDVILVVDTLAEINYVTASAHRVLGYSPEYLLGTKVFDWAHPNNIVQLRNSLTECLVTPSTTLLLELPVRHQDGHWCDLEIVINNLLSDSSVKGIVLTLRDITERKRAVEELRRHAFYDSLTDLPNRALFTDRLKFALGQAKSDEDYVFAVFFLDLDRFKFINDSLGHQIGDKLLNAVARRVELCLRSGDTVARLGGDEFALLLHNISSIEQAQEIAEQVKHQLSLPFHLDGHELFTSTSIGIALGSNTDGYLDDILRNADIAMYHAKALGRANYEVFDRAMHFQAAQRLQLETDLRLAVERQEFKVYYQSIVCLRTGEITGFEALIRWSHPIRGLISPISFIGLAEETGLIIPIGWWVLREACRQMQLWHLQFPNSSPMTISVNISSQQFSQPDFITQVEQVVQETGLNPRSLKLEITESVLIENAESVAATLVELQALGIQISMDDFGSGYSSLSYLYRLPINTLKIDRSFISGVDVDVNKIEIIRTVLELAWNLGMNVVAEGVETKKQMYQLQLLRCEFAQGYLFSKPLDSQMTHALMARNFDSFQESEMTTTPL